MKIITRDDSFMLITLVLAIICVIAAYQYPADSSGFPRVVATFLILLAAGHLIRSAVVRQNPKQNLSKPVNDLATGNRRHWIAALLVFASAPTYIVLARLFDFEIATFVYLAAGMFALGARKPVLVVSVSVGVMVVVKGLFFVLLDVTRTSTLVFGT